VKRPRMLNERLKDIASELQLSDVGEDALTSLIATDPSHVGCSCFRRPATAGAPQISDEIFRYPKSQDLAQLIASQAK
jgi:hypothetical protein